MIKIAFVIDTIESPTAGTEKQLLLLIKHLDRSKFEPYLCVLRGSEWLKNEFNLCQLYVSGINSFKTISGVKGILNLSSYLKSKGIHIVQVHFRDSSIAGILAAKLAGIKTIIGTRRNQGYWLTPAEKLIQKFLDTWITCYIVNSSNTKEWQMNSESVSSDRIHVIYNGFDFSTFGELPANSRKSLRETLAIPSDSYVVTIVANLRPVKDHSTFLKAAQIVAKDLPNARFLVVGEGSERNSLEKICNVLDILSKVIFLGKRDDIPSVLIASDVGVLTSISESFSNAVVEYMAAGLPVVCTDVGGAREAVEDGVNGFVVPVGDHGLIAKRIVALLESDKIEAMRQESLRRSKKNFSFTTMIENSESLYSKFLKGTA